MLLYCCLLALIFLGKKLWAHWAAVPSPVYFYVAGRHSIAPMPHLSNNDGGVCKPTVVVGDFLLAKCRRKEQSAAFRTAFAVSLSLCHVSNWR